MLNDCLCFYGVVVLCIREAQAKRKKVMLVSVSKEDKKLSIIARMIIFNVIKQFISVV